MTIAKPKGTPRKKKVALTSSVKSFIIDKLCEGLDVMSMCRKHPSILPSDTHIYKAIAKDDEFGKKANEAYGVLLMRRIDELNTLSSTPASLLFPQCADWREAEATKKAMIDAAKFILGKMAPVLSNKFKVSETLAVNSTVTHTIQAINYHQIEQPKDMGRIIEQHIPISLEIPSDE